MIVTIWNIKESSPNNIELLSNPEHAVHKIEDEMKAIYAKSVVAKNFDFEFNENKQTFSFTLFNYIILATLESEKLTFSTVSTYWSIIGYYLNTNQTFLFAFCSNKDSKINSTFLDIFDIKSFSKLTMFEISLKVKNIISFSSDSEKDSLSFSCKYYANEEIYESSTKINLKMPNLDKKRQKLSSDRKTQYGIEISKLWGFSNGIIIVDSGSYWNSGTQIYDETFTEYLKEFDSKPENIANNDYLVFSSAGSKLAIWDKYKNDFEGTLQFEEDIDKIDLLFNFFFVTCGEDVYCRKMKRDTKTGAMLTSFGEDEGFKNIEKLDGETRKSLSELLCWKRDSKSLKLMLEYLNRDDEQMQTGKSVPNGKKSKIGLSKYGIQTALENNATDCINELFTYLISIKGSLVTGDIEEIQNNLLRIISSNSPKLSEFLDSLLSSKETMIPVVDPENIPMLKFCDDEKAKAADLFEPSKILNGSYLYDFQKTLIKLPSLNGSQNSLLFDSSLVDCKDISIFKSNLIKYYILKKWMSYGL